MNQKERFAHKSILSLGTIQAHCPSSSNNGKGIQEGIEV
jgi:hypothetical protein